jgi:glucose-6-phosphate isomerase
MKNFLEISGVDFAVETPDDKLLYEKKDFSPAVNWVKDFDFDKYAYKLQGITGGPNYFGTRYMEKTADQPLMKKFGYEYDVTVFEPGFVGSEFIKTVGHYHSHVPGLKLSFPEVYEVMEGRIDYLLQDEPDENDMVNVIFVQATAGDKIVMPPNYGHVSINVYDGISVESNIQKRDLPKTSDYSLFKKKVGGALYRTVDGLEENPNYKIKSLRIVRPLEKPDWGLTRNKPLYTAMVESPEKFKWLTEPQSFKFNLDELFEDVEI